MKIGSLRLDNTELWLLQAVREYPGIGPGGLVWARWPNSKQPEKKIRTLMRSLRRLERLGLMKRCGNGWIARMEPKP